ncbi:unnamed protein product [Orchesella dallaii]|uniref:Peptidase S8/S53 domain-containing protein n=1 Tax=Orchesella dallaii TaxID=48710 RepID=A0ABP1RCC5_9HEXA
MDLKVGFLSLALCVGLSWATIDSDLIEAFSSPGIKRDVLIDFAGGNSRVIETIESRSFRTRVGKVKALTQGLQGSTQSSQGPVQDYLGSMGIQSKSYWSSNQMVVRSTNLGLLRRVDSFPQVSRIRMLPTIQLSPIPSSITPTATTVQWGVAKVGADKVWSTFNTKGEGVVVANIDTGVLGIHEALQGNFRADHGWYDPANKTATPNDQNGHGTHTMGTIAGGGEQGIGVAPGAKWIACKGCASSGCDGESLLSCGQWMLSPTNPDGTDPDASKIPDIVSNSWGSAIGGNSWYNATINAWKAAGILHAFAIGNSGPICFTGGSPGDQASAFAVGSTDINDRSSSFSSRGPSLSGFITKPEISAPGSDIYSAWNSSATAYKTISGTSMATPHVAGAMALMLSAHRNNVGDPSAKLPQTKVESLLETTAVTKGLSIGAINLLIPCSGGFLGRLSYPNNYFGYGRLDALQAVNATVKASS